MVWERWGSFFKDSSEKEKKLGAKAKKTTRSEGVPLIFKEKKGGINQQMSGCGEGGSHIKRIRLQWKDRKLRRGEK